MENEVTTAVAANTSNKRSGLVIGSVSVGTLVVGFLAYKLIKKVAKKAKARKEAKAEEQTPVEE